MLSFCQISVSQESGQGWIFLNHSGIICNWAEFAESRMQSECNMLNILTYILTYMTMILTASCEFVWILSIMTIVKSTYHAKLADVPTSTSSLVIQLQNFLVQKSTVFCRTLKIFSQLHQTVECRFEPNNSLIQSLSDRRQRNT